MALIDFNTVGNSGQRTFNNDNNVSFFNMKPETSTYVTILLNKLEDFEFYTVHPIVVNGKNRKISCLRPTANDAISKCPLCEAGVKLEQRLYVPMVEFVVTPTGVEQKPVIWADRSSAVANELKGYLESYGPLSQIVCKIDRHGEGLNTRYMISPNVRTPFALPQTLDTSAFNNYKALGTIVMNKSFDEAKAFVATGTFPQKPQTPTQTPAPTYQQEPVAQPAQAEPTTIPFNGIDPLAAQTFGAPAAQRMPWETPNTPTNGGFVSPVTSPMYDSTAVTEVARPTRRF